MESNEQVIRYVPPVEIVPQFPKGDKVERVTELVVRQRRIIAIVFVAVVTGAILAGLTIPPQFDADLKFIVLHNREEASVSAGSNNMAQAHTVSEEDLNSEAEILKSRDLLASVVTATGLDRMDDVGIRDRIKRLFGIKSLAPSSAQSIEQAVDKLERNLKVKSVKKTNLIDVVYSSKNADLSVYVLNTLANLYLQKHVEIHRIPGAVPFFTAETKRFEDELAENTRRLEEFTSQTEIGSAQEERDRTTEKLVTFEADMRQAEADVHDREQRILVMKSELSQTPERMKTQVRESDNGALMEQLKASLHDKELKQSELAATFSPNYPPLRSLAAQIEQTQKAIETEGKSPVRDEVSDATPTHTFLVQELARTNADLASRRAQAKALAVVVRDYRKKLSKLEQTTIREADLDRNVKTAETNYLLYRSKLEDSRITDALDRKSIVNVSIAQAPMRPERPSNLGLGLIASIGIILGCCAAVGSAYAIDNMATTYRTRDEVEQSLGISVLGQSPEILLVDFI